MAKKQEKISNEESLLDIEILGSRSDTMAYGEKIKLTDAEQLDIIKDVKDHIQNVIEQRGELGIEDEWKDAIDLHNGNVEPMVTLYDEAPDLHIHVTSMTDNILKAKIKKSTLVKPMMLAQPIPGMQKYDKNAVSKKEKYINNKALGEMNIEEELDRIYDDAIVLGTGIAKVCHVREIDVIRTLEVYEPNIEGLTQFTMDFADDKDSDEYKKNLRKLENNIKKGIKEPVEVWVEKEQITKYQPEVKCVDPINLYIDCYVTDLKYHRIVAEKRPDVSWAELKAFFDNEYFEDKNILEEIKKKYPKEFAKKKYTLIESNYMWKNKQNDIRIIVTFIEEFDSKLCKSISFPYMTNTPNYEIYKIINRRNSIYGVGIPSLLMDTNLAIDSTWNLMMASGEFAIAPPMVANITGTSFDPSIKQRIGPTTIFWLGANDKLAPMGNNYNLRDGYQLLEYLHRYTEWITGVSAYMSGRESPMDPNAPASKAYMLLQESNLRISEYIKSIGKCNSRLFTQIDKIYYQYYNAEKKYYDTVSDDKEYSSEEVSHKELGVPVTWVPQLSDISTNKALEKEENFKIGTFLLSQPMIAKLPKAVTTIYEIMLRGAGGEWEKQIDTLLPESSETDMVNKVVSLMQEIGPKGVMDIMAQLMQAQGAPQGSQMGVQGNQAPDMATGIANPAEQAGKGIPQEMVAQG